MGHDDQARPPFEAAAEEELGRIRAALEESRQRRKRANEAFDSFVRSFRETPDRVPVSPPPARTLPREPRAADALQTLSTEVPLPEVPSRAMEPVVTGPAVPEVPAGLGSPPRFDPGRVRKVALFTALAWTAGVVIYSLFTPARVTPRAPAVADTAAPTSAPQVSTPAPPPESAADPRLNVQLVTVRPVWMRVLVDGERTIERELPAGQKIPLAARETIAVRAGDAGAVRISIEDQDQGPLGPDGAVASRTFTKPR